MNKRTPPSIYRQNGVALIISLLLLTVITLLSLTAMRSSTIDTKIASNHQFRQLAFQAAENAFAKLTSLPPDEMRDLNVPGTPGTVEDNVDFIPADPNAHASADLTMTMSGATNRPFTQPGKIKISGFGLNIKTLIFRADAFGEVDNTNARVHNRMEVALVRE